MDIEFKNVNQGDSIIIRWNENNGLKLGMIDCHSDNDNPSLKYIKDHRDQINEIEFIFISHPHFDHFSGIIDLLRYCEKNKILIKELGFTFDNAVTFAYSDFAISKAAGLLDFFEFIISQKRKTKNRTIQHSFPINHETKTKQFEEFEISFLRPLHDDLLAMAKSYGKFIAGKIKSAPDLNNYSSVIELIKKEKSILFTSDAPRRAFKSLTKYYFNRPNEFHLVQIPHHGSLHNHDIKFWKSIKKIKDCPSIFSVGDEPKDKLPDFQVVDELSKENYKIHSTNIVYGIRDYLGLKNAVTRKPTIMRRASKVVSRTKKQSPSTQHFGDQVFTL